MPCRLSELLDPGRIALKLQSEKRTTAINEVARLLESHPRVTNFAGFYGELLARERLDTTCLGNGVALPHARTEHVETIVVAVGRSVEGVCFENANQQTVQLLFVLGTPKSNPMDYLTIVSLLCKVLKDDSTRQALLAATTPQAFIEVIAAAESRIAAKATAVK